MSREKVLSSIQAALGRQVLGEQQHNTLMAGLANPTIRSRPSVSADLHEEFVARLDSVQTSHQRLARIEEVPAAVQAWLAVVLQQHGSETPSGVVVSPALQTLDWRVCGKVEFGRAQLSHHTSVTPCMAAIAETGSLVMAGSADSPSTLAFLPENHIVVLHGSQLVRYIEDVWPLLRVQNTPLPRALNINTGPSRTADIEQTLEIGAHGPRRMRVLLVSD